MLVLDTNVWVYAFTGSNAAAMEMVERVASGESKTVVDTYLYWEVINALGSSKALTQREITKAQDQFGEFVWGDVPTVRNEVDEERVAEYADSNEVVEGIETMRTSRHYRMLGTVCGIQPKDAPILALAFEFRDEEPTIHTNDAAFAAFDPAEYDLPAITVEYVSIDDREAESNFYGQHLP